MDHIITRDRAILPVDGGQIDTYLGEEQTNLLVFDALLSLRLELSRSLGMLSCKANLMDDLTHILAAITRISSATPCFLPGR